MKKQLTWLRFATLGIIVYSVSIFGSQIQGYISRLTKGTESKVVVFSNVISVLKQGIPKEDSLYFVAGGDIMLSRNIGHFAKKSGYDRIFKPGNYNPVDSFSHCSGDDCLLFFNLESLFSTKDNDIPRGGFVFKANTGNIQTLLQLKKDHNLALSLANNHTINTQYSGVVTTIDLLSQHNILHMGAGLSTGESRKFAIFEKNNIKVCVGAYSYEGQFVKVGAGKISWNKINESEIKQDLQKMIDTGCDVKILSLHWGAEYKISPNASQKALAHNFIDFGADLILGGHSHVPGEFEIYSGKYIFYSFGNFIFDQGRGKTTRDKYERIFDYSLNKTTVPTYISLLAGFNFHKTKTGVNILLDQLVMTTTTDGIHSPLDAQTYSGILARIKK